jgi:hypothetical protein
MLRSVKKYFPQKHCAEHHFILRCSIFLAARELATLTTMDGGNAEIAGAHFS